ncbi:unnamed protein product [Vitrella brassicaformis CCMP3155]|uniref:Eukaryotic translation initiation factor 2A n=2 Tax=Vitrella brassicaformis TaxID=1169539 RepID=A0A0G4G9S5_VITBC|nr:unnamed protein product [Vitrella brassicaformis CCMP3155]|eukprot:CEM25273.1 unnamed protein product [Vitrella brassicaformis CCMP3155]
MAAEGRMRYHTLTKDGLSVFDSPSANEPAKRWDGVGTAVWSKDGTKLAISTKAHPSCVELIDGDTLATSQILDGGSPVRQFSFSPLATYLISLHKYDADQNKDNFIIWDVAKGEAVCRFPLKSLGKAGWPPVKWTPKEKYAARMVSNEVQVFDGQNVSLSDAIGKIYLTNVAYFEPAPEEGNAIALFVPEMKGAPASARVYSFNDLQAPVCSKSFFQAQEVKIKWNFNGSAMLLLTQTDVDATGQSYYGSTNLHFMRSDGSSDCLLVGGDKGPVHDVAWSPTANEFLICSGLMPAELSLHDGKKGDKKLSFGKSRKNTIRWNPFGRLVAFGGFGNLAGDLEFWDMNKKKAIGSCKAACTVECDWAPDGRHFITSITTPRLRVDNGITVYYYDASVVSKAAYNELYFAEWQPAQPGAFKDRPVTPARIRAAAASAEDGSLSGSGGGDKNGTFKPAGAYRPPGSTGALAALMRAEREADQQLSAKPVSVRDPNLPPGAGTDPAKSKAALKNAKRKKAREAKKAAAEPHDDAEDDEKEGGPSPGPADDLQDGARANGGVAASFASASATSASAAAEGASSSSAPQQPQPDEGEKKEQLSEADKKVRGLRKKLREIERLKEMSADSLSEAQRSKVACEADILEQIKAIEG